MRRIEGPPVGGGIGESMQKGKYIKGVPVLKAPNIALVREAEEKGFIQKLPIRQQDVIRRRYPEDGKPGSLSVIGDDLNLTREGVRQLEARAFTNIQRVKEGRPPLTRGGRRPRTDIDVDEVVRLYVEEKKSEAEIADLFKCSITLVSKRLRATDVSTRRGRRKEVNINLLAWQYFAQEMGSREIAGPLGVSYKTVLNRLKEAGYQMRRAERPRKK